MKNVVALLNRIGNLIGGNVAMQKVTTNYGISVYYKKICGVRIVHIEGNPSGQIGTSGHTFALNSAIVDSDPYYRVVTQAVTANNNYTISLQNNTVKITPNTAATAYVNATFVY